MRFGVHILADVRPAPGHENSVEAIRRSAATLDASGISRLTTGDVIGNHLECATALTLLATSTKHCDIGPLTFAATTRSPSLLAATLASLHEISAGRAFGTIARGDGASHNAGQPVARLADLLAYTQNVKDLLDGKEVSTGSGTARVPWPSTTAPIKLGLVAEGQRTIIAALEKMDTVEVGLGIDEQSVGCVLDLDEVSASSAELWWNAPVWIGSPDGATHHFDESVASSANHALRGDYDWKRVPLECHPPLAEFHRRYDYAKKFSTYDPSESNVGLMRKLGLEGYLRKRFGIIGSPQEIADEIRAAEDRGVSNLTLVMMTHEQIDMLIREVLPRL